MPNSKKIEITEKLSALKEEQEEAEAARKAARHQLPYKNLAVFPIDAETLHLLPEDDAEKGKIVVLEQRLDELIVGLVEPEEKMTRDIIKKLAKQFNSKITQIVISPSSLNRAMGFYLVKKAETPLVGKVVINQEYLDEFNKKIKEITQLKERINKLSTTEILETIIAGALKNEAGDIHIEPAREIRLRYRIDGVLQEITTFPQKVYDFLLNRIKLLSDLTINVHDKSQDGRFTIQIVEKEKGKEPMVKKEVEVRVSVLPQGNTETIVMRLLGIGIKKLSIENLGLRENELEALKIEVKKPNGLVFNTGPTGSGKTTTLYAFLNYLNNPKIKIITVEDPIEYRLEGIVQTQISKNYSFAQALRAILRQNPNVIMIGEIRDEETAKIAIQSSLTGHLVVSTIHTNDAAGTIQRLINLGVSGGDLAVAANVILAQRMVRKLCHYCKKPYQPDKKIADLITENLKNIPEHLKKSVSKKITLFKPVGCKKCENLAYKGQMALFEILIKDEKMQTLIAKGSQTLEIKKAAQEAGMITLRQDGLLKAMEGTTSLEEVQRVTGDLSGAEI